MTDFDESLEIAPYNPTGRQIFIKTLIGMIIGIFIGFLVFIILMLLAGVLENVLTANGGAGTEGTTPLLSLILIVIAFLATVVGMSLIAGIFNMIYTDKYYDIGKMFSLTLLINIMLFVLFIPLYGLFASDADALFFVLAFHIIFSVFVSYAAMEMSTNPNYAAVHLIGAAIGLALSIFLFSVGYKISDLSSGSSIKILIALPPFLAYTFLPLFHSIREKVYYKFYSMGNNFFYLPSLSEVMVDDDEENDISVETNT